MRHETKTVTLTCDLCNQVFKPVLPLRETWGYALYGERVDVVVDVSVHPPYATPSRDICPDCVVKVLERCLRTLQKTEEVPD